MSKFRFRPWGRPDWLRPRFEQENWCIIACLGTEQRSVKSVAQCAKATDAILLVRIDDPQNGTAEEEVLREKAYSRNEEYIQENCTVQPEFFREDLKASLDRIWAICDQASAVSQNVVLDITSFPKRWFFPMIRRLLEDESVVNLQAVYTQGVHHSNALAENPEILRVLPSFEDERTKHDFAFVGVGFHTHSMLQLFDTDEAKSLQLVFPFPPGPPGIHRNLKFVQEVEMKVQKDERLRDGKEPINYLHLDAIDVSQAFDAIKIVTDHGLKTAVMAPYGPKPFSLAMCLYAVAAEAAGLSEVPVFYSQPQKYAVDYTEDALYRNGRMDSWAYGLKKSGAVIYKV